MPVDISQITNRLELLVKEIPAQLEKKLSILAQEIHNEVVSKKSFDWSPSWKMAIHQNGPYAGQPYFMQGSEGPGLFTALESAGAGAVCQITNLPGELHIGFGHIPTLDSVAPYWRMFEREDRSTERQFSNPGYGFEPSEDWGKRGEGTMQMTQNEARQGEDFHAFPGVLGVNIFGDEFEYRKKDIFAILDATVRELLSKR